MKQMKKDIFGNVYTMQTKPVSQKSFEQKLRESKAKQKYKKYIYEQRQEKINSLKKNAMRSKQGLIKIANVSKKGYNRITDKRLTTLKDKLSGSIYKK